MLGRLARYLRFLGYDVSYPPPSTDTALIAAARAEGRVLLTRDRGILERAYGGKPVVVEIASSSVLEQVAQLYSEGWLGGRFPPRCCECNSRLEEISSEEARHLVPPFVLAVQVRFARCAVCNAVLWEGSHWESFHAAISRGSGGLTPPEEDA